MPFQKILDQIRRLWANLTLRQRITLGVVAVAVTGGLIGFVQWEKHNKFGPLFSDLAAEEAGKLTARLREMQVEYQLADNGTRVLVPKEQIAGLRLDLAAEGLPKRGRIGYELFDKTNLTTTDFQEQVNFRRAIEGELERSIATIEEVENARVHVTPAKDSVFAESRRPAKASVTVKLKPDQMLSPGNIQAVTHLAASAVDGLLPENVSVIDSRGQLLTKPKRPESGDPSAELDHEQILYRQKVEADLMAKVNATLEPLLGSPHYRAAVAAEVDFSTGEQSEEVFDPTKSVMSNQQRTEDLSGSSQPAGVPGTPSNLPRPAPRPGENGKLVQRRTENISYQSTRTVKRVRMPKGDLRRLSVSVLVDQTVRWDGVGPQAKRILDPPPPEVLKKIADVVAAATGIQPQRGDSIIVESIPFEATLALKPPPAPPAPPAPRKFPFPIPSWVPEPLRDPDILTGLLIAALILAIGLLYLLYRLLSRTFRWLGRVLGAAGRAVWNVISKGFKKVFFGKKKGRGKLPEGAAELEAAGGAAAVAGAAAGAPGLPGGTVADALPAYSGDPTANAARAFTDALNEQAMRKAEEEARALEALQVPEMVAKKSDILAKHIATEALKDPEQIAYLLRNWLQADNLAK